MTHKDADGGVILVNWSCIASSVAANDDDPVYSATESGKLVCDYDASSPEFIPYDNLTEDVVLGWVYTNLAANSEVENETPDQAKARIETNRIAKVWAQIERANQQSDGLPWTN
jgi:hypothetical protein